MCLKTFDAQVKEYLRESEKLEEKFEYNLRLLVSFCDLARGRSFASRARRGRNVKQSPYREICLWEMPDKGHLKVVDLVMDSGIHELILINMELGQKVLCHNQGSIKPRLLHPCVPFRPSCKGSITISLEVGHNAHDML